MKRIDFEYLDPRHEEMLKRIRSMEKSEGFRVETLEQLCRLFTGKTPKQYVSEGIPIIKSKNLTNEGIDWNTECILKAFFDQNKDRHLKENDVLINTTGVGTLERVALFDKDILCMTDGHITGLRIRDISKLLSDYLIYYLHSFFGQTQIEKYTVGSTGQTELNDSDLKRILILYPKSIQEQRVMIEETKKYEIQARNAKAKYLEYLNKCEKEFAKHLID